MVGRQWILVLAAGCADVAGIGNPTLAADAAEVPCVVGGIDLCLYARPQTTLDIDVDMAVDTTRDCNLVIYEPPTPSVCVIYASEIHVGANVSASGSRALVLAASSLIEISGSVDVSAYRDKNNTPAAANIGNCPSTTSGAYGGGAGGSFAGKGGSGGTGIGGTGGAANAGAMAAPAVTMPAYVRGGCSSTNGNASAGGGVWIAAGDTVRITANGSVLANGAGGDASDFLFGGTPGGGSGGMIRIAAPHIVIAGQVSANGGGGAEGTDASGTGNGAGGDGADGMAGTARASGGSGVSGEAGDGGAGGAGSSLDGLNGSNATGADPATGGGGGGGAGFIHLVSEDIQNTGTTSPPPTL